MDYQEWANQLLYSILYKFIRANLIYTLCKMIKFALNKN